LKKGYLRRKVKELYGQQVSSSQLSVAVSDFQESPTACETIDHDNSSQRPIIYNRTRENDIMPVNRIENKDNRTNTSPLRYKDRMPHHTKEKAFGLIDEINIKARRLVMLYLVRCSTTGRDCTVNKAIEFLSKLLSDGDTNEDEVKQAIDAYADICSGTQRIPKDASNFFRHRNGVNGFAQVLQQPGIEHAPEIKAHILREASAFGASEWTLSTGSIPSYLTRAEAQQLRNLSKRWRSLANQEKRTHQKGAINGNHA